MPQPVAVLGRSLDLATLRTGDTENSDAAAEVFSDPNWAESVSLYSLARSWMCSGVDLDPFHILRHDTAESVLLGILSPSPSPLSLVSLFLPSLPYVFSPSLIFPLSALRIGECFCMRTSSSHSLCYFLSLLSV